MGEYYTNGALSENLPEDSLQLNNMQVKSLKGEVRNSDFQPKMSGRPELYIRIRGNVYSRALRKYTYFFFFSYRKRENTNVEYINLTIDNE